MAIPQPTAQAATPVECHLARVQLRRYMAGDDLPEPLFAELTAHLQACPECKAEAHRLREALSNVAPLDGQAPLATQHEPMAKIALLQQLPTAKIAEALRTPKTMALSIGLAVVLVLATTVFRNPTSLLGPKAAAVAAEEGSEDAAHGEGGEAAAHGKDASKPSAHDESADHDNGTAHGDEEEAAVHEDGDAHSAHETAVQRTEHSAAKLQGTVVVAKPNPAPASSRPAKPAARRPRAATRNPKAATRRPAPDRTTSVPSKPAPQPATPAEPYVRVHGAP